MTDLGDVFGVFPNRPDHPDFWRLSDIALQHDGATEDRPFNLVAYVSRTVDFSSLQYIGTQRAQRIGLDARAAALVGFPMFLDGFLIGEEYGRRRAEARPDDK